MIAIIDYEMGNLRSVQKALEKVGAEAVVTQDQEVIKKSDKLVLPGVGAIRPAMDRLNQMGFVDLIKEAVDSGKLFLGICLGLQLLFEKSDEGGDVAALGILKGGVHRFSNDLKVPHMGWNQLNVKNGNCPLFNGITDKANTYFCHSYFVKPADDDITATTTDYGIEFASSVNKDNVYGVQFHPEKSQTIGLTILKNFVEL